jgi:hypothetical protein
MTTDRRAQFVFHRTGHRLATDVGPAVPSAGLCPALLARHTDLTSLRYDYPIVLAAEGAVRPLSEIVDAALAAIPPDHDHDRLSRQALRLEAEIRTLASQGWSATLSELRAMASAQLGARLAVDDLNRLRQAMPVDGDVVDCDRSLPYRLIEHLWRAEYARKAARFQDHVGRLVRALSDILRADAAGSAAGRTSPALAAGVGALDADAFDFDAMARLLARTTPDTTIPEARRHRIQSLLAALGSHGLYPDSPAAGRGASAEREAFIYTNAAAALDAIAARVPAFRRLARAITMAELEVSGRYDEAWHDSFFDDRGDGALDPDILALVPDALVVLDAKALDGDEQVRMMDLLSSGLPVKVVLQTDEIWTASPIDGHLRLASRHEQFVNMAIGHGNVHVLQAPASHLVAMQEAIERALQSRGASFLSVFSGAVSAADLPPYLVAAAALEARAFPILVHDPDAAPGRASRWSLEGNPQRERDWPEYSFSFEDGQRRLVTETMAFTILDLAACDSRQAGHFAVLPAGASTERLTSVDALLRRDAAADVDLLPFTWLVDGHGTLHRALADAAILEEAAEGRRRWRALQQSGATHTHTHGGDAEPAASGDRPARSEEPTDAPAVADPGAAAASAAAAAGSPAAEAPQSPDEPYIETPRCTTCNECTRINNRMFAYDANKQAYVKDADAGSFAELVEAAESCQVSIIHPGKPRNLAEPGLDELLERAAAFV